MIASIICAIVNRQCHAYSPARSFVKDKGTQDKPRVLCRTMTINPDLQATVILCSGGYHLPVATSSHEIQGT